MVKPIANPKPGMMLFSLSRAFMTAAPDHLFRLTAGATGFLLVRLVHLIKNAAIGEMLCLRFLPIAGDFGQREQLHFWKLRRILLEHWRRARPVIPLGGNFLSLGAV